jgi:hypothetical protein
METGSIGLLSLMNGRQICLVRVVLLVLGTTKTGHLDNNTTALSLRRLKIINHVITP